MRGGESGRFADLGSARRDFALGDFLESDVDEAHARIDLHERAARRIELADAARDEVDENVIAANGGAGFIEKVGIHGNIVGACDPAE